MLSGIYQSDAKRPVKAPPHFSRAPDGLFCFRSLSWRVKQSPARPMAGALFAGSRKRSHRWLTITCSAHSGGQFFSFHDRGRVETAKAPTPTIEVRSETPAVPAKFPSRTTPALASSTDAEFRCR